MKSKGHYPAKGRLSAGPRTRSSPDDGTPCSKFRNNNKDKESPNKVYSHEWE